MKRVHRLISDRDVHIATKKALRGDLLAAKKVLNLLWSYREVPAVKYVAYALVYQITMNAIVDTSNDCRKCGGVCCKQGAPLPLYDFDLDEMRSHLGSEVYRHVLHVDGMYLLPRPCPFLRGWECSIHRFKPYACLSYPFATEDEQLPYIERYNGIGIPVPYTPSHCIAAHRVVSIVVNAVNRLRTAYGRDPTPIELLEYLAASTKRVDA